MFRTVPLPIIRSFSLYTQQWCMSYRFADSLRAGSGRNILILLASCVTYTIAVCTVKNSWWWTEELSETCRVSFQNKFRKLVHLVGFIVRIFHDAAQSPERQISFPLQQLMHNFAPLLRHMYSYLHCLYFVQRQKQNIARDSRRLDLSSCSLNQLLFSGELWRMLYELLSPRTPPLPPQNFPFLSV